MPVDPDRHHRRSVRLRGYDYAGAGAYFVTVVAQDRVCLFGEVVDGEVRLSAAGLVVASWWEDVERRFPTVVADAVVAMPNHIHGIEFLGANILDEEWQHRSVVVTEPGDHIGHWFPLFPVASG